MLRICKSYRELRYAVAVKISLCNMHLHRRIYVLIF